MKSENNIESADLDDETLILSESINKNPEAFEYEAISKQKLQYVYDLSYLKQIHPEFEKEIVSQIKTISLDSTFITQVSQDIIIKNLKLLERKTLTDTTTLLKLQYNKMTEGLIKKDSIHAIITNKDIVLNGKPNLSSKIKFKRIKN